MALCDRDCKNFKIPKFSPSNISPSASVFKRNYCDGAEIHWQIIIIIIIIIIIMRGNV